MFGTWLALALSVEPRAEKHNPKSAAQARHIRLLLQSIVTLERQQLIRVFAAGPLIDMIIPGSWLHRS